MEKSRMKETQSESSSFEVLSGETDNNIVAGNYYNKYATKSLIARYLVRGFERSLKHCVGLVAPHSIHEVGCGEGYLALQWVKSGYQVKGSDFSEKAIAMVRKNALAMNLDPDIFYKRDIYELNPETDAADLIVCCEVLEHLENPELALQTLTSITRKYIVLSVPNEPLWSCMNIARGKYLSNFGNTPGHRQRWSRKRFVALVSQYCRIYLVNKPTPWTMLLCEKYE